MNTCFTLFNEPIDAITLPQQFTFPFYYEPHPLSLLAAKQLQEHLKNQQEWSHNFGLDTNQEGLVIGKMFGVLVVQNKENQIGYLAAFSGKLADENHHAGFVPPVFDNLQKDGFFLQGSKILAELNQELNELENNLDFKALQAYFSDESELAEARLAQKRQQMKIAKDQRKILKNNTQEKLSKEDFLLLEETLKFESLGHQYCYKKLAAFWKERLSDTEAQLNFYLDKIATLKEARKTKSAILQQQLFSSYTFLNQAKQEKSLYDIFLPTIHDIPPAGAGECAAPKLLQYAFLHDMKPLALAEFWWGQSPKSEVRKHGFFYPVCRGKCEPILAHMLEGIEMEPNPLLNNFDSKSIEIVYEDDYLLAINKPAEFFSVPGKNTQDSVATRMKQRYPKATGPLVVHRLDMSTSGLMLVAKTKEVHQNLQHQFIKRTIKKRYVAILDGLVDGQEGYIDLPLRVDLDNRPQQLVCFEYGKNARTKWEVIERKNQQTKVHFYPITGRTHQLRVHAAHPMGLNTPILGDDLYGHKGERLFLHAESIEFVHPITKERICLQVNAEF